MTTLQGYINQVRELVHDTNGADFTDATLTNFINQARVRVSLDTHCVRGFFSVTGGNALNTIPEQENYFYNGTVGGVTVTGGGANYSAHTAVALSGGGGIGAAAQAVIENGVLTAINMTNWGSGYSSSPTVNITDATGTGATATATALVKVLDILSITVLWGDLRLMFRWQPFTMFQAICRQYVNQFNVPCVFTMHQGIKQFFLFQPPDQAYTMEMDHITIASALTDPNQEDTQIVEPFDDAVQLYALHLCQASLQNHSLADYWYSGHPQKPGKYDLRIRQLYATAQSRRIYNPYYTFMKRLRRM